MKMVQRLLIVSVTLSLVGLGCMTNMDLPTEADTNVPASGDAVSSSDTASGETPNDVATPVPPVTGDATGDDAPSQPIDNDTSPAPPDNVDPDMPAGDTDTPIDDGGAEAIPPGSGGGGGGGGAGGGGTAGGDGAGGNANQIPAYHGPQWTILGVTAACADCHGQDGAGGVDIAGRSVTGLLGLTADVLMLYAQGTADHPAPTGRVDIKFPDMTSTDFNNIAEFLSTQ